MNFQGSRLLCLIPSVPSFNTGATSPLFAQTLEPIHPTIRGWAKSKSRIPSVPANLPTFILGGNDSAEEPSAEKLKSVRPPRGLTMLEGLLDIMENPGAEFLPPGFSKFNPWHLRRVRRFFGLAKIRTFRRKGRLIAILQKHPMIAEVRSVFPTCGRERQAVWIPANRPTKKHLKKERRARERNDRPRLLWTAPHYSGDEPPQPPVFTTVPLCDVFRQFTDSDLQEFEETLGGELNKYEKGMLRWTQIPQRTTVGKPIRRLETDFVLIVVDSSRMSPNQKRALLDVEAGTPGKVAAKKHGVKVGSLRKRLCLIRKQVRHGPAKKSKEKLSPEFVQKVNALVAESSDNSRSEGCVTD